MAMNGYSGISIPTELMEDIQEFIKNNPEMGYKKSTELIKEAIREKILKVKELKYLEKHKK